MGSIVASGNLRGDFAVSISNAKTTGSARFNRSSMTDIVICPAFALTVYHFPIRISQVSQVVWGGVSTLVDGDADVVGDVPFAGVDDVLYCIEDGTGIMTFFHVFIELETGAVVSGFLVREGT